MKTFKVTLAQEDDGRLRMHHINIDAENDEDAYNKTVEHFPPDGHWFILEIEDKDETQRICGENQSEPSGGGTECTPDVQGTPLINSETGQ